MKKFILVLLLTVLASVLLPVSAWAQTSTIDTDVGDIDTALDDTYQTRSFYASGLHWFFWVDTDDDQARYSTSADLTAGSWAAAVNLIDVEYGNRLSVWYDEGTNTVHLAAGDKSESDAYYRMGTPEVDGAITWADNWDYVCEAYYPIHIITDSNGYPFLSAGKTVYRSTTRDGTFTSDGAPYVFTGDSGAGYPVLVPLTSGKVAAVTTDGAIYDLFITRWDGFNWSAEKELDDTYPLSDVAAINVDDDVYIVLKRTTGGGAADRIAMVKYTYGSNSFGSIFYVYNNDIGSHNDPTVTKDTNDDIYILWPNYNAPAAQSDIIYYRVYDVSEDDGENSLSDTVEFVDESVLDGLPAACQGIHCDYDSDGFLKVYYPADAARAKVKGESLLDVDTLIPATVTETSARLRGEIVMLGLGSASAQGFEYREEGGATSTETDNGSFGPGVFNYDLSGLSEGITYQYRAFATDATGTVYGEWVEFQTSGEAEGGEGGDAPGANATAPPEVTTLPATYVAVHTAQVHGRLDDDGDGITAMRFRYTDGVTTSYTPWVSNYATGDTHSATLTGLDLGTAYQFRVEGQNTEGTDEGAYLNFTTLSSIQPPGNVTAYAEETSIVLSWTMGAGSTKTLIRYKKGGYPTSTTDGSLMGNVTGGSAEHTGLESGATYYYSLWGVSGNLTSATYATVMSTTISGVEDEDRDAPDTPGLWFISTDYTRFSNMPLYDQINDFIASLGMPLGTGWFFGALLICVAVSLAVLAKSRNGTAALIVFAVALAISCVLQLLPMWMVAFVILAFVGVGKMASDQQRRAY